MGGKDRETGLIYLAGGCFWGLEAFLRSIPGVLDTLCGYANGSGEEDANYQAVCTGLTGFRETVRVLYDPERLSLDALLFAFFAVIDPTVEGRQGPDIGSQYQTGIYYADTDSARTVQRIMELERSRYREFAVESGPLKNFFPAEEYHRRYLERNPSGYCHISPAKMARFSSMRIDPAKYPLPDEAEIREALSERQYSVARLGGTEPPGMNEYHDFFEKGIYVDIVTGEPLFSSADKYDSGCGWPAFTRPIEAPVTVELEDFSHGMFRTEVRSRAGNSHLGHVFRGDPESPNGVRYCINSAALRFVPCSELEKEGYGYLRDIFD